VTGDSAATVEHTYTPKYYAEGDRLCTDPVLTGDAVGRSYCGKDQRGPAFVPAPWRSLIYRNVDTPYTYFDDYVPFPHMPMNTPGFDCRAPRIMGEWMVGLPARALDPHDQP